MDSCPFWPLIFVAPLGLLLWALQYVCRPGRIAAYLPPLFRTSEPPFQHAPLAQNTPVIPVPFRVPPAAALERTELEQYIDRRMEELLEPSYWSRVVSGEISRVMSRDPMYKDMAVLEVEGLHIFWIASKAPNRHVYLTLPDADRGGPSIVYLRDPLGMRYTDAFRAAWPNQVPEIPEPAPPLPPAEMIARLEACRRQHEAVS